MEKSGNRLVILSGTPGSGKNTITESLTKADENMMLLKKYKMSPHEVKITETTEYYMTPRDIFLKMVKQEDFAQCHYRYDRGYGVTKEQLKQIWKLGKIPIIHNGKQENLSAFFKIPNVKILSVLLLASRSDTISRISTRSQVSDDEINRRIAAYDEEREELGKQYSEGEPMMWNIAINTSVVNPWLASEMIINSAALVFANERRG